ncbi:hypothetical protein Tco_1054533 [Tanacetum coccineum]|uniref:Carbohydrate-binding module family 96 domain-containing protein n=1 Tax=Tanacetum coccineum TaxID=301880 RepID=A0ABQ5GX17_9ASTR
MAYEQSSLEPALHEMTPATLSSGLVLNPPPSTPFVPPSRHEWDLVFQPVFDEFFSPSLRCHLSSCRKKLQHSCEYELWKMRWNSHIQMIELSLWEVIREWMHLSITNFLKVLRLYNCSYTAEERQQKSMGKLRCVRSFLFDMLQKLSSQLEIHVKVSHNKIVSECFLRSLSSEWNTHTIVWRNKPKIDTLSLDDLYNNMKIYELEVKGTSRSSTNTQNVAFVSSNSTNSTNGAVNTAHGATTLYALKLQLVNHQQ